MYIVHVIPLKKGIPLERLSYYARSEPVVGCVVNVPIRKKETPSLVVGFEDAQAIKALLRTSHYETKKMTDTNFVPLFTPAFVDAAHKTARYCASTTGSIITHFTPNAILSAATDEDAPKTACTSANQNPPGYEKLALQASSHEREEAYKTLIRQNFASNHSVVLLVPSAHDAERLKKKYERGIEKYTFALHSALSKKKQQEIWRHASTESHPVLIICTYTFLSLPRTDIGAYIVDRENATFYKAIARPFTDARVFAEHLARAHNAHLILADSVLSTKTHKELQERVCNELDRPARRARGSAQVRLIDVKKEREAARKQKQEFPILSQEVFSYIRDAHTNDEHTFVHAPRRGIAPHTVCRNCGTRVSCAHCGAPVVLHQSGKERILLCHRCGASRDAHERCGTCDGWDLVSLGIGIERIIETLTAAFPKARILRIDSDTTKTPKKIGAVIEEFYATKGAILVGTNMALPYITKDIAVSVVASADALLSIPDFAIEERVFALLTTLREKTKAHLLIQTRTEKNAMLTHVQKGTIGDYIKKELALRAQFKYPPYTNLIKITRSGTKSAVTKDMTRLINLLAEYSPRVFSGFIPNKRGAYALNALLRVHTWPDEKLMELLRALPQSFTIEVDPEATL